MYLVLMVSAMGIYAKRIRLTVTSTMVDIVSKILMAKTYEVEQVI